MKSANFFKRPVFWISLSIISIASVVFLYFNFEKANPLVNVQVEMSRDEAFAKAAELSKNFNLGPTDYREAAIFYQDSKFQNYTELEGGGLDVFKATVANRDYQAYQWKVRHFKEDEVNEVTFSFTPEGDLYGFTEKIGEDIEGAQLSADSALILATNAASIWNTYLQSYELVEKSMNEKISGRLDHEFVFERSDVKINESKFRISIQVSGDKVTSIHHFVKIPDDFDRRYSEMRSANDLISTVGQVFLFIIYGLIGIGFGLFILLCNRYVIWKKALYWSVAIGLGTGLLYALNVMPLLWFDYDTSQAAGSFVGRRLLNALMETVLMGGLVFISALAGEGLGRYLFGNQIQLWKVWSKGAGSSVEVLGQTVGAYLFVPFFLALDVLYYFITTKYLGWWNPAGTLSDPNILAENLPWFGSIAISLQAGFWEEIICRAVPLAGVYYLVRNKKSKNIWMILTLLAQTLIFGMLHANYPQSPSFVRVFEMVIPFLIFGLIYLRFGLLPVIIAHYAVDVFWISLPLWVANSPGIWVDRIIILLLLFVPLWVVLYRRIRNKKWNSVPENLLNKGWHPLPKSEKDEFIQEDIPVSKVSPVLKFKWLIPAAVAGLVLWAVFTFPIKNQSSEFKIDRTEAISMAEKTVLENFNFDASEWTVLTSMKNQPGLKHKFIWQEFEAHYNEIQNSFLNPPYWNIRLVNKDADVEQRAEEFTVNVSVDGRILGFNHSWPEKKMSANLSEEEALALSQQKIAEREGDIIPHLKLVKVEPKKLEYRTDWQIEFSDTVAYSLDKGQGRYSLSIAGSEVNSYSKYVFVPEAWERNYDQKQGTMRILYTISNLIMYVIIILGIVLGIVNWTRKRFSVRMFVLFGVLYAVISVSGVFNSWNEILSNYFTGLPFGNYVTMTIIGAMIGVIFLSIGIAVIGGFSCEISRSDIEVEHEVYKAILVGVVLAGIQTAKMSLMPQLAPKWMSIGVLNDKIPVLGVLISSRQRFVFNPAFMMILFYLINNLTKNFFKRKALGISIIFVAGFLATGANANSVNSWFLLGICSGVIFMLLYFVIKNHLSWLPLVLVVSIILNQIETVVTIQQTGILIGAVLSILFWGAAAILWLKGIKKCNIYK